MLRVSAYIRNTNTATGNLIGQVSYTDSGGITSGLQFLPAMGTGSLGGVSGDTVIYTNGSAVNINVNISAPERCPTTSDPEVRARIGDGQL